MVQKKVKMSCKQEKKMIQNFMFIALSNKVSI